MIYKIIAVAVVTAVLAAYLKNVNSEFFVPVLIVGGVMITVFSLGYLTEILSAFNEMAGLGAVDSSIVGLCVKITIVGFLVEFSCGAIDDCGMKSLSDKLAFAGRLIILCMGVPVFVSLIELVVSFLGKL